jgi:DNA-binding CsgD family transcriptional regulator
MAKRKAREGSTRARNYARVEGEARRTNQALDLLRQGESRPETKKIMGITNKTLAKYIRTLGPTSGVPKYTHTVLAEARRTNRVFDLLEKGRTKKQIMRQLGISSEVFNICVRTLRSSFKESIPSFIPPKSLPEWNRKKARRATNLIETAKSIMEGEKTIKTKAVRIQGSLSLEKHRRIIARLMTDPVPIVSKIAEEIGVTPQTVERRRQMLIAEDKIRADKRAQRKAIERDPTRKTNFFRNKRKRDGFLDKKMRDIENKATMSYREAKAAFDSEPENRLPEEITEDLRERLDWKLQTWPGPKAMKLEHYFNYHLHHIAYDIKRTARRGYRKQRSLEAGMEEGRSLKQTLEGKFESKDPIITPAQWEQVSQALKLNLLEKAVLFGWKAGMTEKVIGDAIGMTESNASQIIGKLKRKIRKAIHGGENT